MGFPRQEYWSGLPFPSLGDLPDPGIETGSPTLQADSLPSKPPGNWDSKQKAREKDSPIIPLDEKLILIIFLRVGIRSCPQAWFLYMLFVCFCYLFFGGHATWHVGSYFSDQELTLCPLQWKHRALTTGCQGSPRHVCFAAGSTLRGHQLLLPGRQFGAQR